MTRIFLAAVRLAAFIVQQTWQLVAQNGAVGSPRYVFHLTTGVVNEAVMNGDSRSSICVYKKAESPFCPSGAKHKKLYFSSSPTIKSVDGGKRSMR